MQADHRPVGGHADDSELIDPPQLPPVLRRRAAHAGQLLIKPEVTLERDLGRMLSGDGDGRRFLGLDRLVQAGRSSANSIGFRSLFEDGSKKAAILTLAGARPPRCHLRVLAMPLFSHNCM